MPVKPTPPVDVLRGVIAVNRGTRGDLDVHMHVYDAERLLRHIEAVEAERATLANALQKIIHAYDDHATDGYFDPDRGMVQPDIDRTMEQGRTVLSALGEDHEP